MAKETIQVPDIGGAENVEVIEITVSVGDAVKAEDSLIVLESDKASMDIPAPKAGKVAGILLKVGDKVSQGDPILELETEGEAAQDAPSATAQPPAQDADGAGAETQVAVPDIGGAENVDVLEVCVKVGDQIKEGDSVVVLESDKASMEVPSPASGKVVSVAVKEGDKVSEGAPLLVLTGGSPVGDKASPTASESASTAEKSVVGGVQPIKVPDIGGAEGVDVIEVCIAEGDDVKEGDALIVLESDKASMEIPSPVSGKVKALSVKEGDKVSMGTLIAEFQVSGGVSASPGEKTEQAQSRPQSSGTQTAKNDPVQTPQPEARQQNEAPQAGADVYAGPAVRKLARQLGVDLREVKSSGPRGRILKDDVRSFVKTALKGRAAGGAVSGTAGIPQVPPVDFAQFGDIDLVKMSKIKKLTAANMSRNWLNVPHVTQFDDADITEMEAFRQSMKAEAEKAGTKLTPVPFLLKACAAALKAEPTFNVSLHHDGEHIVQKKYVHIGMAVDTPAGLMVPVIRDVDKKGLFELSAEVIELAKKARDGKLLPKEMQGGCFTISSLGAIGGRGFTPIVNAPEVSILGVSRSETRPVWDGKQFIPRLMLPLSLSYDHRAINGSDAGRFLTLLCSLLGDIRRLLV